MVFGLVEIKGIIIIINKRSGLEFHRSRWWAYKWLRRFQEEGLDGLRDRHRSGRPTDIAKEKMIKIRKELLSNNPSGWKAKEVII